MASDPMAGNKRLRWYQFSVRTLMLAVTAVCILTAISATIWKELTDPLRLNKQFHRAIRSADRLVILGLDFESDSPADGPKTLLEIIDRKELAEVFEHIQLAPNGSTDSCFCGGYPEIDWYCGKTPIARTGIQHGRALLWEGFPDPVLFTDDSAQWIASWLGKHGIAWFPAALWPKEHVEQKARDTLRLLVPAGFQEAIRKAEAAADSPGTDEARELTDKHIRSLFRDTGTLYSTLFQSLGCVPMRWDCWYEPEQGEAFEFLTRAPREELDAALRLAARSKIPEERQGAARVVFSQFFMTEYGKTEDDISAWMTLLADVAYTDPLPENRRLILDRLLEYRGVKASGVLEFAAADPDRTVRRKAIRLLAADGGPKAVRLLRRLAAGEIKPRLGQSVLMDYSQGTGNGLNSAEMREQDFSDTDREAAEKAMRGAAR